MSKHTYNRCQNCLTCGAPTHNGKRQCPLHHPRKHISPHRDKYATTNPPSEQEGGEP